MGQTQDADVGLPQGLLLAPSLPRQGPGRNATLALHLWPGLTRSSNIFREGGPECQQHEAAHLAQVRPGSGAGLSRPCQEEGPRAPRAPRPEPTVLPRAVGRLCPLPSLQPRATPPAAGPAPPVLSSVLWPDSPPQSAWSARTGSGGGLCRPPHNPAGSAGHSRAAGRSRGQ